MEKYIHEPSDNFDFKRVSLKTPFSSSGSGGFFSKFAIDGEPFYIKTPKCSTKQGFVKSGAKRYYCDLVFSVVDNEDFIRWMENLVSHSQQILLEKSGEWFQDPMNEHEIEDATISPLKSYRAGKYYLVRCNVPATDDGSPEMKAYDENAREIPLASITENMDVVSLLELRGVKCSLKSFQFEVNIKQIMAVKKINILETCLLGGGEAAAAPPSPQPPIEPDDTIIKNTEEEDPIKENEENPHLEDFEEAAVDPPAQAPVDAAIDPAHETMDDEAEPAPAAPELEEVNLEDFAAEKDGAAAEPIILKNPNELYYNMYFEAKKRAKEARMSAITAYLEAKNIKMLYDLDDLEDSEDEDDFMDFTDDDDSVDDDSNEETGSTS